MHNDQHSAELVRPLDCKILSTVAQEAFLLSLDPVFVVQALLHDPTEHYQPEDRIHLKALKRLKEMRECLLSLPPAVIVTALTHYLTAHCQPTEHALMKQGVARCLATVHPASTTFVPRTIRNPKHVHPAFQGLRLHKSAEEQARLQAAMPKSSPHPESGFQKFMVKRSQRLLFPNGSCPIGYGMEYLGEK